MGPGEFPSLSLAVIPKEQRYFFYRSFIFLFSLFNIWTSQIDRTSGVLAWVGLDPVVVVLVSNEFYV